MARVSNGGGGEAPLAGQAGPGFSNTCEMVLVGLVVSMIVPPGVLMDDENLWHEPRIVLNGPQALVHGDAREEFDPRAGVPHEGQSELGVTDVFHAGEHFLERWRNGVGARASVDGNEVARRAKPMKTSLSDPKEGSAPRQSSAALVLWDLTPSGVPSKAFTPAAANLINPFKKSATAPLRPHASQRLSQATWLSQ